MKNIGAPLAEWQFCSACGSRMAWRKIGDRFDRNTGARFRVDAWTCSNPAFGGPHDIALETREEKET